MYVHTYIVLEVKKLSEENFNALFIIIYKNIYTFRNNIIRKLVLRTCIKLQ